MSDSTGLTGHLELVCDVDSRGLTRMRHQSFRAPVHLSKPYRDHDTLVLNVVNPTAGFLDGDRLRTDVRVETGARLLLTTPSASRIHTMRGGCAEVEQRFRVENGGSLEIWPELLIPQRGARYRQRTEVALETGSELILFETLAPGRVASGEVFTFDELIWSTDLRHAGRLIARERYRLAPGDGSLDFLRRRFAHAYYASALIVAPLWMEASPDWSGLEALHGDHLWLGISKLAEGAFALKMLAADSVIFRRTLRAIRQAVYAALRRFPPDLRRAGEPSLYTAGDSCP